jgi:hypothetical protein
MVATTTSFAANPPTKAIFGSPIKSSPLAQGFESSADASSQGMLQGRLCLLSIYGKDKRDWNKCDKCIDECKSRHEENKP